MNRLQSYYEQLQLPIKSLFFGSFLVAIGSMLSNPYINNILKLDNPAIVSVAQILMVCGGIILTYFPIYVFIKLLSHQKNEPNIVVTGIISYLVFLASMVLLSSNKGPAASYVSYFKFLINNKEYVMYRTGIFGMLAVFLLVGYIYRQMKAKHKHATASSVDRETIKMVNALVGAALLGALFAYGWPTVIDGLYSVLAFISNDVNNPMSLFAYGALERILALTNLDVILHQEFWLGSLGGTWMNLAGESFIGDVNIWGAQLLESVNAFGAGRFTSAQYVLNIFAIPGYLFAIYSTLSNRKLRHNNLPILIIAILVSVFSGILLPIELFMLLTSPTIYFFHLFMTSFVYAILGGLGVALGFSYYGSIITATPGNAIDLFGIMQQSVLMNKVVILLLVGVFIFIAYYAFARFYFEKMALDVLNISNKQERIDSFAEGLGGYDNIEDISSSLTRIHAVLKDREKINVSALHRQGVTRIVETRQGYIVSMGTAVFMIQKTINKIMKQREALRLEEETENYEI